MTEGEDRGRLDGPPESMSGQQAQPDQNPPQRPVSASFDFNNPTVISLLYLSSFFLGLTAIIGVVLAYVWKGDKHEEWQDSHYHYLINTFWIGLVGGAISLVLMLVLIGFLLLPLVGVLVIVRCILSLVNAQKRQPMPNPSTLLA